MNPLPAEHSQLKLRLDPELKRQLKIRAAENRRTLTREIEHRLDQSVKQEQREGATQ